MSTDPTFISLDIETYGSCLRATDGTPLPRQTSFHPARSLHTDQVPPQHLVLSCALTLVGGRPEDPTTWEPGDTMVLDMSKEMHRECLCRWLDHATHLLGANIQFDILYLRRFDPSFRLRLGGRHTLFDLTVLNYLHSEFREGGLKQLGETLGTHTYAESLKDGHKFKSPHDPKFVGYAAADTHNTVMAARELGRRIAKDWGHTDKATPSCMEWYSKTLWTVIRMSESGIPLSLSVLDDLGHEMNSAVKRSAELASTNYGLILEGKGSKESKDELLQRCIALVPDLLDHPLLELTEKTKQVSWSAGNRKLILSLLEEESDEAQALKLAGEHQYAQKILSSYLWPLVHHKRNNPFDKSSTVIPWPTTSTSPPTPSSSAGSPTTDTPTVSASTTSSSASVARTSSSPTSAPPTTSASTSTSPTRACPTTGSLDSYRTSWHSPSLNARRTPGKRRRARLSDGAVYPTWYVVPGRYKDSNDEGGTIQARITCKNPSAQTFPPSIKKAIKSRWCNGSIVWADLSQVEMRVAALLSGDESLISAFRDGTDMHTERTVALFGEDVLDDPEFKSTWRQVGKTINFADLFLASPTRMQLSAYQMTGRLIDLDVFRRAVRSRPTMRPGLYAWQQSLIREVQKTCTLHIPHTGQSRTFVGGPEVSINTVVNFPVQTTAANVTLAIQHELMDLLDLWSESSKPRILMCQQIYDSVCFDVPPGMEGKAEECFGEAVGRVCSSEGYWGRLEHREGRSVPLTYEVSVEQ